MYQRILIPVDGSETARKALMTALQLARDSGGRVRLIHVVEEVAYMGGYDMYGGSSGELIKVMREAGNQILQEATDIAKAAGVEVDAVLYDKLGERLGEVIAGSAKQWNADLIVVGTHGRRGLGRVFLGSGAEQVIRLAPVPVLVIRSDEEPAKTP